MILSIVMKLLSTLTSLYMLLIFIRILLSWFEGLSFNAAHRFLASITDPYLEWFHRFPVLQRGTIDFSPILALGVLAVLNNIFTTLAIYGRITVGIILSLILGSLWSAIAFILIFYAVITVIRFIGYLAGVNSVAPLWRIIDTFLKPLLYRVNRLLYRNRIVTYQTGLISLFLMLVSVYLVLSILVRFLSQVLVRLPF
ncbi:MAG: YggT family protein [Treponemataceae bacterium]|nr:YggT family protein [Treponemataceae bacterium]